MEFRKWWIGINQIEMTNNQFVYVVCGAREHIDTLHFSLEYLKRFSKNTIVVLTDSSRNECSIQHDYIIDVLTPKEYSHHQASIYLKTGIHRFLPSGKNYCYLDTDVIAFSESVDLIFDEYVVPITFASDHCRMDQFSPYAVNCSCIDLYKEYNKIIDKMLNDIDPLRTSNKPSVVANRKKMISFYQENNSIRKKICLGLRFIFSRNKFKLIDDIYYDKTDKKWKDGMGEAFMNYYRWSKICKNSGLGWNYLKSYPRMPDGRSLWSMKCNHLRDEIERKFSISKPFVDFQHWNGGVFLFNNDSHEFLDCWLNFTMEIFKDPNWKTRDQGTLIATVWKFRLQNHPTLDKKWNLIADYHNPYLAWDEGQNIKLSKDEIIAPNFIHVYHHFGDENWDFWRQLVH